MVVKTARYLHCDAVLKADMREKAFMPKEAALGKPSIAVWQKVDTFRADRTMHGI